MLSDVVWSMRFTWGYRSSALAREVVMRRTVPMAHLPAEGDRVELTRDGWPGYVWIRFWDVQGVPTLEFPRYVIDPVEAIETVETSFVQEAREATFRVWHTAQEGNPITLLQADGWTVHSDLTPHNAFPT